MTLPLKLSHIAAGTAAVIVGYSSAVVLVIETARAAGASPEQTISWLVMLGLGMGVTCIGLSWFFKMPVVTAWSTPGAAFLIANVQDYTLGETIGACVIAGLMAMLTMQFKTCVKMLESIPHSLATAMLAGILMPFCVAVFAQAEAQLVYLVIFFIVYLVTSYLIPRYTMLVLLMLALSLAFFGGSFNQLEWQAPTLTWMAPAWSLQSTLALSVPLYLVTMLSQNLPGIAILHSHNYRPSSRIAISVPSALQTVTAPLGGFTFNLAAITAALCMGKEAGDDPSKRYWAGICAGVGYLLLGVFGGSVVSLFEHIPHYLTVFLAGFALLPTLQANVLAMMQKEEHRFGALLTFLCCASGISLFGIGAAIWGLLLGTIFIVVNSRKR